MSLKLVRSELGAFCFVCRRITAMVPPTPPLTPKNGVTLRIGACRDCGAETFRVGGGRDA